jgi:hypothetical protein
LTSRSWFKLLDGLKGAFGTPVPRRAVLQVRIYKDEQLIITIMFAPIKTLARMQNKLGDKPCRHPNPPRAEAALADTSR